VETDRAEEAKGADLIALQTDKAAKVGTEGKVEIAVVEEVEEMADIVDPAAIMVDQAINQTAKEEAVTIKVVEVAEEAALRIEDRYPTTTTQATRTTLEVSKEEEISLRRARGRPEEDSRAVAISQEDTLRAEEAGTTRIAMEVADTATEERITINIEHRMAAGAKEVEEEALEEVEVTSTHTLQEDSLDRDSILQTNCTFEVPICIF